MVRLTFLFPKDKKFHEELKEKVFNDFGSEAEEAVKMIKSLIIPDLLRTSANFLQREVGNILNVPFVVEKIEDSKVILEGGVELSPAKDFRPLPADANLAVWYVNKGRPPTEGEGYKKPRRVRQRTSKKMGGSNYNPTKSMHRINITTSVEREYATTIDYANSFSQNNPYLNTVVGLLTFLKNNHTPEYEKILPVIDYDPLVTYYLLMEPYKTRGEFLIEDNVLFGDGKWNGSRNANSTLSDFKAFFQAFDQSTADMNSQTDQKSYVFVRNSSLLSHMEGIRTDLNDPYYGLNIPDKVISFYTQLSNSNSIENMGPVFPDSTYKGLAGLKKLWQDEFRFWAHYAHQSILNEKNTNEMPNARSQAFYEMVSCIRTNWLGNNYDNERFITKKNTYVRNVAPNLDLQFLLTFVCSSDFLYIPRPPSVMQSIAEGKKPADLHQTDLYAFTQIKYY
ncbi:unnamed protein product [Rhizophagus irregularis]|nr:unnamed protein product [Rhizophagus irregularis]